MIFSIISFVLIIVSTVGIVRIIAKHSRVLASIDIDAIPAERHAAVKDAIIVNRIKRRLSSIFDLLSIIAKPLSSLVQSLRERFSAFQTMIIRVRQEYRARTTVGGSTISDLDNLPLAERLPRMVSEAQDLLEKEQFKEAEKQYIAALAHDSKYIPAYAGLLSLYTQQKEWQQACEVSEYVCLLHAEILKSDTSEDVSTEVTCYTECLHDLSDLYRHLERPQDALKVLRKALKLQGNNPKYLHALIEIYISLKQRMKAERALEELREANPENQKLTEIQERIGELSY